VDLPQEEEYICKSLNDECAVDSLVNRSTCRTVKDMH